MANHLFDLQNFIHLGALLYLICFMFRDQIYLRLIAIAGDLCYCVYYAVVAEKPLWDALAWNALNIGVNVVMLLIIFREARMSNLADDEMNLFRNLRGLSPGQFRRLMKVGQWHRAASTERLTDEGAMPNRLYYVLEGQVEIDKGGRKFPAQPAVFIGELAFLRGKPATASVEVAPQSLYVSWSHADLNKLFARNDELRAAMAMLLNNDLAEKVARS